MHRRVAAALVAALALVVASCGGSESLTRAELVNRIEAACRQAQERVAEGQRAGGRGGTPTDFFSAVLVGQRQLVERVEGLEAPDELADDVETLKEGLAERTDLIANVAEAPRDAQQRALAAANDRMESVTRSVEAALRRLDVRGCS
jgi:hypothetical protein